VLAFPDGRGDGGLVEEQQVGEAEMEEQQEI
jgi:hypothetical protein